MTNLSIEGLAQHNLSSLTDFGVEVLAATLPLEDMGRIVGRYQSVQFVSSKDGGLFMLGWKENGDCDAFSLTPAPTPLLL